MLGPEEPSYSGGHVGSRSPQASNKSSDSGWIPIRGELVVGLLQLVKQPKPAVLIEGGWEGKDSAPLYIARAVTEDGCYPGECGFHFTGACIPHDGNVDTLSTFEVLSGNPDDYNWRPVTDGFELSKIDDMEPVLGGHQYPGGESECRLLYIARSLTVDGRVHLGYVSIGNKALICYDGHVMTAKYYEVLVHKNGVRALMGTYETDGHWTRTKEAERYSAAIDLSSRSWKTIPRIALGITMLDIGLNKNTSVRVETFPQNITKETFICNARSWQDGILHNTVVDWIAIEQPGWQCGVFNSQDVKSSDEHDTSSEHRINFAKPFEDGPPMVFVCFSGINITGNWNIRVYATNVDPVGFTIAIVSCGEEGTSPPVKLVSASITWIAIPGSDVAKRKNVWIGNFATGRKAGGLGDCSGHVDFGFAFKKTPKIFVGLRQFSCSTVHNLRLRMITSNVTTQGMDWKIPKWHDTVLLSAGANFMAVDVE